VLLDVLLLLLDVLLVLLDVYPMLLRDPVPLQAIKGMSCHKRKSSAKDFFCWLTQDSSTRTGATNNYSV